MAEADDDLRHPALRKPQQRAHRCSLKELTGPAPRPIACAASRSVAMAVPTSMCRLAASGEKPYSAASRRSVRDRDRGVHTDGEAEDNGRHGERD